MNTEKTEPSFSRDMLEPGRMAYIVDTEKQEIRVRSDKGPLTLEEVREYVDTVYKGTDIVNYTIRFLPPQPTKKNAQNAMAVQPNDLEFRFRKDHTITNI